MTTIVTQTRALSTTQGASFEEFFPTQDENDDFVDLLDNSGEPTAIMEWRAALNADPVVTLTTENGGLEFQQLPVGVLAVISATDTEDIPSGLYFYDVWVNDQLDPWHRYVIARGTVLVNDHISTLPEVV